MGDMPGLRIKLDPVYEWCPVGHQDQQERPMLLLKRCTPWLYIKLMVLLLLASRSMQSRIQHSEYLSISIYLPDRGPLSVNSTACKERERGRTTEMEEEAETGPSAGFASVL